MGRPIILHHMAPLLAALLVKVAKNEVYIFLGWVTKRSKLLDTRMKVEVVILKVHSNDNLR